MSKTEEPKPLPWAEHARYAGFFMRLVASLIDTVVMLLPLSMVLYHVFVAAMGAPLVPDYAAYRDAGSEQEAVMQAMIAHFSNPEVLQRIAIENMVSLLVAAIITIVLWYYFSGTPGKLFLGMKIVDSITGEPPTTVQDARRYGAYLVSAAPIMLGFMTVMWDPRRQGWHDKLARTVVVYKSSLPPELADLTRKKMKKAAEAGGA